MVGDSGICRILPFCVIRSAGKTEIHQPGPGFALSRPAVLLPNIALCSAGSNFSLHFRILGVWAVTFSSRCAGSSRKNSYCPHLRRFCRCRSKLETPSTKAAEGVFSLGIILIALVVPYDQDLLGRLSFDFVGRALRPKS